MYKLIVSDMDGTLLNSSGEISKENADAIKEAMKSGVEFAIVTGRPYVSAKSILKESGIKCSVIGCNGAQVADENGNIVKTHYINRDSLNAIIKRAEKANIYYHIYDDNYIYTKSRFDLLKVLKNYSKSAVSSQFSIRKIIRGIKRLYFTEVNVKRNLAAFAASKKGGFYKIQVSSTDKEALAKFKESIKGIPHVDITSSNYYNVEVGVEGVTKGTALKELADLKGIKREEIIAMGDNYNDMPMLVYAGCGVAMDNAVDEVKAACSFHTKSNDDHGAAYAIQKLIFDGEFHRE
ncbi:putative phosphatase YwpJ [Oxobacter pfennigii]|uniref:Putative phosphatase YwpJ n=1 Tax=Oxobacter pfennigii TaxID=36849 RepID=A0A0P8YD38_9CLOT|nr:Cof-type HAD-IIB family hydrolase [Oxobacter pfennigii]KPU45145.1 putative phosphatase YwpJ [Oxobacter pfennigii]